ncbi:nucleotide exchange factor GrpE [Roseivivax sp. GX 12232]|uniref:nucleotide exchange factor GrpE n=1 Tax=Roseivivax sp. GX 12232 TaxID=2900547 RepID=UPI001E3D123F|nr:nucleotide exchange factor GrpE [Roseivivax sp. GX 12232]MCE0506294.1 nucleotide exchange factor GrpE [Roseivivax sp. GX 12232]
MADPKNDDFLDDLDALEAEAEAEEEAFEAAEPTEADRIAELEAERDGYKDKFMRALADAENARKRSDRDRREAEQYGGTRLARDLLPVYDNLQRALATANDEQKQISAALLEGVELTLRELLSVFKKHGIEVIKPEVGDRFDPKHHEAMFEAPLPETKAGDIIQVSAEGFMLHDRLLRPAQVGVSSNPG